MKHIWLIISVFGLSLIAYAAGIEAYTDRDAYEQAYRAIDRNELGREASSEKFFDLRRQYLTNKYPFHDHGITLVILGIYLAFLTQNGWRNISAPNSEWKIALLGFCAAVLTTGGYIGDLFLEFPEKVFHTGQIVLAFPWLAYR